MRLGNLSLAPAAGGCRRLGLARSSSPCPWGLNETDCCDAHAASGQGPGCVKTLRGITAPEILRLMVTLRAKKRKNSSSARHYDQIRFGFRIASVIHRQKSMSAAAAAFAESGHRPQAVVPAHGPEGDGERRLPTLVPRS